MSARRPPGRKRAARTEPRFAVLESPIQGLGAFALRPIRKYTRLIEYTGRHLTAAEANARYDDEAMGRHHTFLFQVDEDTVIDGADGGNESRFFNHSCEPNCVAYVEGKRIYLYAQRYIWPGEELVYDYRYERTPDTTEEEARRYACRCGSPLCRGTILSPPPPDSHAGRPAAGRRQPHPASAALRLRRRRATSGGSPSRRSRG